VYEQSTIAAVEQKTKNKIFGVRFCVGTEAKTKFPESASALIQKQKQNSRSPLPR
jgi:hypothetical protein